MTEEQSNHDGKLRWYAVSVASGFEKKMVQEITAKIASENLDKHFGQLLVPTEEVVDLKNGKKRTLEKRLMPGYLFIEMDMHDDAWFLVRSATKVLGFLGAKKGKKPFPLSQKEMDRMLNKDTVEEVKPKLNSTYDVGEVVRVSTGPFADFQGSVEEVNQEKGRLVVSVMIFGRSTPVELEFGQVEKIT